MASATIRIDWRNYNNVARTMGAVLAVCDEFLDTQQTTLRSEAEKNGPYTLDLSLSQGEGVQIAWHWQEGQASQGRDWLPGKTSRST
jgi:hypothetical protein